MDIAVGIAGQQRLAFSGRSGSFWGIALLNLLLTILTLGIFRFWAKTRQRRYLWAETSFAGEPLEYRGRGVELLVGALLAFAFIVVPLVLVALIGAAIGTLAVILYVPVYFGLLWLVGVGIYRSHRYLLSRTAWRGIRGGMTGGGWSYGGLYLKMLFLTIFTLGLASPYVSVRLWNSLWSNASFGSAQVAAAAQWRPLFKRFIFAWIGAIVVYVVAVGVIVALAGPALGGFIPGQTPRDPDTVFRTFATVYGIAIVAGVAIALIMLSYTAAMYRELFGATRLGELGFDFSATTGDWMKYLLGNVALVVLTLGIGIIVLPFRMWSFYLSHLSTTGRLDVDGLLQTSVAAPMQGDGIADAFDMSTI